MKVPLLGLSNDHFALFKKVADFIDYSVTASKAYRHIPTGSQSLAGSEPFIQNLIFQNLVDFLFLAFFRRQSHSASFLIYTT